MALNDISLTAGMRSNLISLQNTTTLLDRTQTRLSTGKKVNTALDNPTNFFAAQAHTQRAGDLTTRKDGMSEAIQAVRAANDGITGITALIEAAKGLTQSARSATRDGRDSLSAQFNLVLTQITSLAGDSGYKGKNFLQADSLSVLFNENGGSFLTINGFDATSAGLKVTTLTVGTVDTTTVGLSGGTGSQTAATAIHTAVLNTSANPLNVITGTFFAQSVTGIFTHTGISGTAAANSITLNISGNTSVTATGTTFTGLTAAVGATGYIVSAVYANGILLTGGTSYYLESGQVLTGIDLSTVVGLSGVSISITYDVTVQGHLQGSDAQQASNLTTFDLAAGDVASGAKEVAGLITSGAGLTTLVGGDSGKNGIAVYVSGVLADPRLYTITGTQIIFTGSAVPSLTVGSIQYNYNTGFSATAGANITPKLQFTGITLVAGQSITNVKIDGVTTTDYTLTGTLGNTIQFATGFKPAVGAQITYTVTTAGINGSWAGTDAGINTSVDQLDAALNILRTEAANLGSNLSVVSIRQDFTSNLVNDLLKGADNLTLADTNEEGANMLMLQTRQQLSTTSLKMASDAAQAVLRLF